ncbi:MAG TPA: hypothetical protein VEK15_03365, partial [Vicinamibacteria bacterium]|nr:hypothetical protein [Vicinamibacteria bacterium]
MRGDWLAAVLGGSVLAFPTAVASGEEHVLRILWRDHHELLHDFEQARSEADAVFRRLGVSVAWEEERKLERAPEARIQVVLMPSEPSGWRLPKNAMGVVLLPERSPQETVYLFYAPILRSLGIANDNGSLLKPRERRDIARAI